MANVKAVLHVMTEDDAAALPTAARAADQCRNGQSPGAGGRTRTLSAGELQRAGTALLEGRFRAPTESARFGDARSAGTPSSWDPAERVVVVAGAAGRVGATTVALAAASVATHARLVEAGPLQSSGLSVASTAELGMGAEGWRSADRDGLRIERRAVADPRPEHVGPPLPTHRDTTVVDVGWSLDTHSSIDGACWLGQSMARFPLVLVTCATAPGMRSLEAALARIGRDAVTVVVTGPSSTRRWSKATTRALRTCPMVAAVADAGRLHTAPLVRPLRDGITDEPLPPAYVSSVASALAPLLRPEGDHDADAY